MKYVHRRCKRHKNATQNTKQLEPQQKTSLVTVSKILLLVAGGGGLKPALPGAYFTLTLSF